MGALKKDATSVRPLSSLTGDDSGLVDERWAAFMKMESDSGK
jgi:hypothetical protein